MDAFLLQYFLIVRKIMIKFFSLIFVCHMTLLRYLGVGAGAGAGAGAEVGADKKKHLYDLALYVVFGLRHVTCGFLKKRINYFNCRPKKD